MLANGLGQFSEGAALSGIRKELLKVAQQFHLEGLIAKKPDSHYEARRRSGAWVKVKLTQQQEFVIGGYTPPGGSRKCFGALLVGFTVQEGSCSPTASVPVSPKEL